jgi:hypothetical protein
LEPTQKLDCGINLFLDPDSKPKLSKIILERRASSSNRLVEFIF